MSRALWQSRRPIYGKFAHVVDLTVKYRNSMQGHQAKKTETTIQQLLPSSVIQKSESFPSLSVNLMYCEKVQILSFKKQELIPSDMTYDFIYANILRLGFEKENEENTLVHQLFVHKNCFLPLVHQHLYNPLHIELHGSPIDCTALGHHDFLSPHILSRLRPPATRATVANIRRVMHITERPPCNAKSKLVKLR